MTGKPVPGVIRVLHIDDNEADRELFRRFLARDPERRYEFIEAETGEEGMAKLHEPGADILLLDYRLPDTDGITFLAALAQTFNRIPLPVVLLTGQGAEAIAVEAMKKGAQDYLVKGDLTQERLRHAVGSALENASLRAELDARYRDLEARNTELADYAAVIAHDLRGPLQAILMAAELVLLTDGEALPRSAQQHLQRMISSATRMGQLLSDLLRYARAGAPDEPPTEVVLDDVLADVLAISRPPSSVSVPWSRWGHSPP